MTREQLLIRVADLDRAFSSTDMLINLAINVQGPPEIGEIDKAEGELGIAFPRSVRSFLSHTNGISLHARSRAIAQRDEILWVPKAMEIAELSNEREKSMKRHPSRNQRARPCKVLVCARLIDFTILLPLEATSIEPEAMVEKNENPLADWIFAADSFDDWLSRSFDYAASPDRGFRFFHRFRAPED